MVQRYNYKWLYEKILHNEYEVQWCIIKYQKSFSYRYTLIFKKDNGRTVTLDLATINHWLYYYMPKKMPKKLIKLIIDRGLNKSNVLRKFSNQKKAYIIKAYKNEQKKL